MSVGSSENCAGTKSKGTPSGQTACRGLMNVDLGAMMMAKLQRSHDARLCVANSECRSTDKARQPGAARPIQIKNGERSIGIRILEWRLSVHRRLKQSIEVVGQA